MALIGDGRVMTAEQGLSLHLVDQLGSLDDALTVARKLAGDTEQRAKVVMYKRPMPTQDLFMQHRSAVRRRSTLRLELPGTQQMMPAGFYFLWQP